jgi:predicted nuclease with RNAse H fold
MTSKVLGIGWDVGGWMGSKQGVAAASFDIDTRQFEWIGEPVNTNIRNHRTWTPATILSMLDERVDIDCFDEIVVGIDASLGFPSQFRRLVNHQVVNMPHPAKEIDNPFAYRYTEQHLFEKFGKKPLSATFDKLGNNTTLALYYALQWCQENGYRIVPRNGEPTCSKTVIEVYPALVKTMDRWGKEDIQEELLSKIPENVPLNSDAYDAAICALLALLFKGKGQFMEKITLKGPDMDDELVREEGWIYYI